MAVGLELTAITLSNGSTSAFHPETLLKPSSNNCRASKACLFDEMIARLLHYRLVCSLGGEPYEGKGYAQMLVLSCSSFSDAEKSERMSADHPHSQASVAEAAAAEAAAGAAAEDATAAAAAVAITQKALAVAARAHATQTSANNSAARPHSQATAADAAAVVAVAAAAEENALSEVVERAATAVYEATR